MIQKIFHSHLLRNQNLQRRRLCPSKGYFQMFLKCRLFPENHLPQWYPIIFTAGCWLDSESRSWLLHFVCVCFIHMSIPMQNASLELKRIQGKVVTHLSCAFLVMNTTLGGKQGGAGVQRVVQVCEGQESLLRNCPHWSNGQEKQVSLDVYCTTRCPEGPFQNKYYSKSAGPTLNCCCVGYFLNDRMLTDGDSQKHSLDSSSAKNSCGDTAYGP